MTLITYKILASILIFFTSIITIAYPLHVRAYPKHHPFLELADAFASGIFLGAALFHMLPNAREDFASVMVTTNFPLTEFLCAFGFLLLLFLERLAQYDPNKKNLVHSMPLMFSLILIIHALIEGAVVGINSSLASAFVIFLAVIAHKSSESFALAVILNRCYARLTPIVTIVVVFSLMTPLGILLGAFLPHFLHFEIGKLITGGFNAFAAGTFLYMSTLHHVNHHQKGHEAEGLFEFVFLFVGLMVMAVIAIWA